MGDKIEFKKIFRVSPSQFSSMKNCSYKLLLAEAFNKRPRLPNSPNAYLGIVLHKILELISKGNIINEADFNSIFDKEIRMMEIDLEEKGFSHLVPLQNNVKDFGIKKIQLKKHLRSTAVSRRHESGIKYISEKLFESKDKLVCGKIDLIIEVDGRIEIIDFKTGAITENVFDDNGETYLEVKNEYQDQLMLYAYLYFDCTGKFPTKLSIVDLDKQIFNFEFSEESCKSVFEEAKTLLIEINKSVETSIFKANPNELNCKYCLYRPACSFYMQLLTNSNLFNDVCGLLTEVTQYENGNVTVVVENGKNRISVTGFACDKFDYFKSRKNLRINLFNLRKEADGFVYSSTKSTTIYE